MDTKDIDIDKNKNTLPNKFIICRYGCGTQIKFDKQKLSKNGKFIPLNLDGSNHNCTNRVQGTWAYEQNLDSISNELNGNDDTTKNSKSLPYKPSLYRTSERREFTNRSNEDILKQIISIESKINSIQSKIVEVLQYFREFSEWEYRKSKWK